MPLQVASGWLIELFLQRIQITPKFLLSIIFAYQWRFQRCWSIVIFQIKSNCCVQVPFRYTQLLPLKELGKLHSHMCAFWKHSHISCQIKQMKVAIYLLSNAEDSIVLCLLSVTSLVLYHATCALFKNVNIHVCEKFC